MENELAAKRKQFLGEAVEQVPRGIDAVVRVKIKLILENFLRGEKESHTLPAEMVSRRELDSKWNSTETQTYIDIFLNEKKETLITSPSQQKFPKIKISMEWIIFPWKYHFS